MEVVLNISEGSGTVFQPSKQSCSQIGNLRSSKTWSLLNPCSGGWKIVPATPWHGLVLTCSLKLDELYQLTYQQDGINTWCAVFLFFFFFNVIFIWSSPSRRKSKISLLLLTDPAVSEVVEVGISQLFVLEKGQPGKSESVLACNKSPGSDS